MKKMNGEKTMVHNLIFYNVDMYIQVVKLFKNNGIYTVRVDDIGDNLRLTGFNNNKTILTQIYIDGYHYNFIGEGFMYLNLDFTITNENILKYINDYNTCTDNLFIIKDKENQNNKIYNEYYFGNSIDQVKYNTAPIAQDMKKYIDGKIDKSLSKSKCKIKIDTDKLKNVFNILYYLDGVYFNVSGDILGINTDDFSFNLTCNNKSDKKGKNIYKPNEVYNCLEYLPSDRVTLRFDEKSPLFIKSKYKGMTSEHTIRPLHVVGGEK